MPLDLCFFFLDLSLEESEELEDAEADPDELEDELELERRRFDFLAGFESRSEDLSRLPPVEDLGGVLRDS